VASETFDEAAPANDALLVQVVRTALGRRLRGTPRINISSCSFVVTLHGTVRSGGERARVEAAVREVAGVEDVVNKLRVTQGTRSL
jgi:osmotically-inducible protein OsmY